MENKGVKDGVIHLEQLNMRYRLTGTWLFHSGDGTTKPPSEQSPAWRNWQVPDGQETLKLDATESNPGWLRLTFHLSAEFKDQSLSLLLPANGNYTILLNKKKIREYRPLGEIVQTGTSRIDLEAANLKVGKNSLYLMGDRLIGLSGPSPEIFLGKVELVEQSYLGHWVWNFSIFSIFIFMGIYHLILFFKRRQQLSYLWLGILLICSAFYVICSAYLIFAIYPSTWIWLVWWYSMGILFPTLFLFVLSVFRFSMRHWFPKTVCISFGLWNLFPTLDLFLNDWTRFTFKFGLPALVPLTVLMHILLIAVMLRGYRQKQTGAGIMLISYIIYIGATLNDLMVNQNVYLMPLLIGEGTLLFMWCLVFVQGVRFAEVHGNLDASYKIIEEQNKNLEKKVELRTKELEQTLDEVQTLKVHQDGDYFLTSLILNPLGKNHAQTKMFDIEFFMKQKKEFSFRKWDNEIGGDINIANDIVLGKRKYIIFLNGDAMGKSMQGAGGALVLGAIFHSIVDRIKASVTEQKKTPERLLHYAYLEMQKVFESFDGSMLMSVVLGLMDEGNGFLYYINAEHPFSILYRNKNASFIENELLLRKLGTLMQEEKFSIQTFQMEPEDSLIFASDGRDDIYMGLDEETGQRIINEDPEQILGVLTESEGDLERTVAVLKGKGELTDDTSFIKITYKQKQNVWQTMQYQASRRRTKSTEFLRAKNWEQGLREGLLSLRDDPSHSHMILQCAWAAKMYGSPKTAANLGERLVLRDPGNIANLMNLADIYLVLGNLGRARHLLKALEELNVPDDELHPLRTSIDALAEGGTRKEALYTDGQSFLGFKS